MAINRVASPLARFSNSLDRTDPRRRPQRLEPSIVTAPRDVFESRPPTPITTRSPVVAAPAPTQSGGGLLQGIKSFLGSFLSGIVGGLKGVGSSVVTGLKDVARSALDGANQLINSGVAGAVDVVKTKLGPIGGLFSGLFDKVQTKVTGWISSAFGWLGSKL